MDAQFNNSRFARVCLARCYLRQTAGMLAALALLAGPGAPGALGQKVKVQFIPSPTPSAAQTTAAANPLAPRPMDSNNNGLGPVVGLRVHAALLRESPRGERADQPKIQWPPFLPRH